MCNWRYDQLSENSKRQNFFFCNNIFNLSSRSSGFLLIIKLWLRNGMRFTKKMSVSIDRPKDDRLATNIAFEYKFYEYNYFYGWNDIRLLVGTVSCKSFRPVILDAWHYLKIFQISIYTQLHACFFVTWIKFVIEKKICDSDKYEIFISI